jgi:UDP-N-acetylmuramyl pentapeptide phosphotransferase/UDP-N-acetylglucosamine-1-phosphate transferase
VVIDMLSRAMPHVLPAIFALAGAWVITFALTREKLSRFVLDRPNARSLHASPVPRTGGIALCIAAAATVWLFGLPVASNVLFAVTAVAAVSLLDDVRDVPAVGRLSVHVAAAAWLVFSAEASEYSLLTQAAAIVAIAWAANLYNFMDGADGLAAGMAVIGFLALGLAAAASDDEGFARINFIIAAVAAGFLPFNLEPAKIFLGDVGSVPLGFIGAVFGLYGWSIDLWPLWFPVMVFSPFVVDSTVTLAQRALRRERIWRAHHDHYYQRLVRMGWSHRYTALVEYSLMAAVAIAAIAALKLPPQGQAAVLATVAATYAVMMRVIDVAWRNHLSGSSQ